MMAVHIALPQRGGKKPGPRADGDRPRFAGTDGGQRVAIVEDELMVAWALQSMVEDLGYEVAGIYARGETALRGIDPEATDIVLMDINLGGDGLDGVETARELLDGRPYRILFISAYADPATEARIAEAIPGAPLLRKPVSADHLADALRAGPESRH